MNETDKRQTVTAAGGKWHKIVALLILKFDLGHVVLTSEDIQKMIDAHNADGVNVMMEEHEDGIHVYIVTSNEAKRLAQERAVVKS